MGTDIHGVFEAKINGQWQAVPTEYTFDRHYFLFACLADVRNGYGFAGIPTHSRVEPISEPRGFPDDWTHGDEYPITKECAKKWEQEQGYRWMGDHSFSWLTADEILAYSWPTVARIGVISLEQFKKWDGKSSPESWSGDVSGGGVVVSNPAEIKPDTTHVRIMWVDNTKPNYFIDEVKRLKDTYGEVRFVFGFDS